MQCIGLLRISTELGELVPFALNGKGKNMYPLTKNSMIEISN